MGILRAVVAAGITVCLALAVQAEQTPPGRGRAGGAGRHGRQADRRDVDSRHS
jgi:hypothetical protein